MADDAVRWSEWRWVDSHSGQEIGWQLGAYAFDRAAYEATIIGAQERIRQMPADELAHDGKRFLWPWQWGWKLP